MSTGPVDVVTPTLSAAPVVAACTKLAAALPASLDGPAGPLMRRPVTGDPSRAAAWGDPAVVLECGVDRADLQAEVLTLGPPGGSTLTFAPDDIGAATAFTTGDLSINVRITVPDGYDATLLVDLVPVITTTIAAATAAPGA